MQLVAAGLSDVGRLRAHNEDSFAIELDRGLFVVADGMGGHQHGEIASRLAVDALRKSSRLISPGRVPKKGENRYGNWLSSAVEEAHEAVIAAIQSDFSLLGMGTTMVAILVRDSTAAIAHVGDSRAYRLNGSGLEQLTRDHTWVREQIAAGQLSEQQAREHPLKNVVTQALGGTGSISVDSQEIQMQPGDLFLLCSDGLTGMVEDTKIAEILRAQTSLEAGCRELVELAIRNGGVDNVTVLQFRAES